jgi:rod shape-determining protein MreD
MFKKILKVIAIFILVVIQITLMPYLGAFGYWPNLVLILALIFIINNSDENAFLVASLGGLFLDFASPLFFGFFTICLICFCLATKYLINKFLTEISPVTTSLIVALVSTLFNLVLASINHQINFFGLAINFFYSMVISYIIFYSLSFILKRNSGFSAGKLGLLK